MQCVGTLSWSEVGLGSPFRVVRRAQAAPKDRKADLQRLSGQSHALGATAACPVDEGMSAGTPGTAPVVNFAPVEANPLDNECATLVRRCMDGDSSAWAELVRTHHRRVYGLCYRFTGNPADAEDMTQEVFLKIYSNLNRFDTVRGSMQVWITTMTRNLLVDNFRRTRNLRSTGSLDDGWESVEELKPIDRLTANGPSPHESAAQKELAKMVQDALARVSVDLREAVILRDLQDMDYKEIAQVLGIPEGTVKSRISRGRAELARLLERNRREVM